MAFTTGSVFFAAVLFDAKIGVVTDVCGDDRIVLIDGNDIEDQEAVELRQPKKVTNFTRRLQEFGWRRRHHETMLMIRGEFLTGNATIFLAEDLSDLLECHSRLDFKEPMNRRNTKPQAWNVSDAEPDNDGKRQAASEPASKSGMSPCLRYSNT
jgi:hypothetical protein